MRVEAGTLSPKNRSFHRKNTPSTKNAKHAILTSSGVRSIMQMLDYCCVHASNGRTKEEEKGACVRCVSEVVARTKMGSSMGKWGD